MKSLALTIGGMTCEHCAASVREALAALPGVGVRGVDLTQGRAEVDIQDGGPPVSMLSDALRKAGYMLQGFKPLASSGGT